MPFASRELDDLFKMKFEPQSPGFIKDALKIEDKDNEVFDTFFTEEEPQKPSRYTGDSVRIRYLGHACVLIDPLISYRNDAGIPRYSYADLPKAIDYVLITHNHQDHCMFETLLQLRHKIKTIIVPRNNGGGLADPSLKLVLQHIGFAPVIEIDEMETIPIPGGTLTGIPFFGEHADLNIRTKIALLVNLNGKSFYAPPTRTT